MKIRFERDDTVFEYELAPMSPDRFEALCKLAGAAVGGGVLLGAVRMVGAWAIGAAVVALFFTGLYKLMKEDF